MRSIARMLVISAYFTVNRSAVLLSGVMVRVRGRFAMSNRTVGLCRSDCMVWVSMNFGVRSTWLVAVGLLGCSEPAQTPRDAGSDTFTVDAPLTDAPTEDLLTDDAPAVDAAMEDAAITAPQRLFLRDGEGRALVLHGANVGSKEPPAYEPDITGAVLDRMAHAWGFNFVRYLIFWDAIEPHAGTIDTAYLDAVARRVDDFASRGIFVLLDMHQDVYARRFCCDGAPEWAIRDDGQAFVMQSLWSLNYLQPAVKRAFDNFWAYEGPNRDLQDHYGDAWVAVARRFHDHPAVIGYDLMNEPSPGSQFSPLEALRGVGAGRDSASGSFDRERLGPFYQRLINRIRTVDQEKYVFVEPRYGAAAAGAEQYLPVMNDPRAGAPRVVFAPHLYSVPFEANMNYDPSDRTVARWEAARIEETRSNNLPIVMGEFGMDQTFPGAVRYLDDVLELADRMMLSWAYWDWSPGTWGFWDPAMQRERPNLSQLVRVFAQRVSGTPVRWQWSRTDRVFTLVFVGSPGVTAPTEIFIPASRLYPEGYSVTVSDPEGTWSQSWNAPRQILSITTQPTVASRTVTVSPRVTH